MASTTNWTIYSLADIWDMVKNDNFDNHEHVDSWERMRVLCGAMAESLHKTSEQLADRWPPAKSPASAVFKDKVDGLVAAFKDAALAAGGNGPTLNSVNVGFAVNHSQISNLVTSWHKHEQDEATRVAIARTVLTVAGVPFNIISSGLPTLVNNSMSDQTVLQISNSWPARLVVDQANAPQVPSGWRTQHNNQARAIMTGTDLELVQAKSGIVPPPVLDPKIDGPGDWPPRVPPPGGGGGFGGGSLSGSTSFNVPPPPVFPPGPEDRTPSSDPILSGGQLPPSAMPPGYPGGPPGGLPAPGSFPSTYPAGAGPVPWVTTPAGKALAPGVPIGGPRPTGTSGMMPMGGGAARPGPTRGGATGASKGGYVAPPGGMIGGRPPVKGAAGTVVPSARGKRREDDDDGWAVASGVPGVLTPDPEPDEYSPGPGVIGIDR